MLSLIEFDLLNFKVNHTPGQSQQEFFIKVRHCGLSSLAFILAICCNLGLRNFCRSLVVDIVITARSHRKAVSPRCLQLLQTRTAFFRSDGDKKLNIFCIISTGNRFTLELAWPINCMFNVQGISLN